MIIREILEHFWKRRKTMKKRWIISIAVQLLLSITPIILFSLFYFFSTEIRCSKYLRTVFPVNLYVIPMIDTMCLGYFVRYLFASYEHGVLTCLAVVPYFFHYIFPYVFILVLIFTKRAKNAIKFGFLVGTSSFLILVFQIFFPTAPPWIYPLDLNRSTIEQLQCSGIKNVPEVDISLKNKYAARFSYFHDVHNITLVAKVFSMNRNVFGAFPSMHSAWVMCSIFSGGWATDHIWIDYFHLLWLSWAVIYANHHFLLDILCTVFFVYITLLLYGFVLRISKNSILKNPVDVLP